MKRDKLRARFRAGPSACWYKIRNQAGTDGAPADVIIYDEIGYWGVSAQDFIAELRGITAPEISLRINSPGGEIFDGIAIYNTLRAHTSKVTAYVDSLAASIASVIAMAGDRIVMQPHSQMMIHDGSGLCIGDAADMREMADLLDRQSDNIAAIYAERAGGTARQWRERMRAETWYSDAEAVESGLADEVAKIPRQSDADPELANRWDLSVFNYAGREAAPPPHVERPAQPWAGPATTKTVTAAVVADEPEPDDPEPEPVAWDANAFRLALQAAKAAAFEFDPDAFRASLAALADNAPLNAVEPAVEEPVEAGWAEPEPEPEPTLAERIIENLTILAAEAPAVAAPQPAPPPVDPPPAAAAPVEPARNPWAEVAEVFHAAVEREATSAPAPTVTPTDAPDEGLFVDSYQMARAIKEAAQL